MTIVQVILLVIILGIVINLIANMIWKYLPGTDKHIDVFVSVGLASVCVLLIIFGRDDKTKSTNNGIDDSGGVEIGKIQQEESGTIHIENIEGNKIINPPVDKGSEVQDKEVEGHGIISKILRLKAKDRKRNLLEALYGFDFDLESPMHLKILKNISSQVRTEKNRYGVALDIDRLELIYDKAPLVCRDLADLEIVLQNQLEIYEQGRALIIRLFGLKRDASSENDALLRQIVADYESKIRTAFRTKGIRLNLKRNERETVDLKLRNVREVIEIIGTCLELRVKLGTPPGSPDYDVSHIDQAFFPTGGYNIL